MIPVQCKHAPACKWIFKALARKVCFPLLLANQFREAYCSTLCCLCKCKWSPVRACLWLGETKPFWCVDFPYPAHPVSEAVWITIFLTPPFLDTELVLWIFSWCHSDLQRIMYRMFLIVLQHVINCWVYAEVAWGILRILVSMWCFACCPLLQFFWTPANHNTVFCPPIQEMSACKSNYISISRSLSTSL